MTDRSTTASGTGAEPPSFAHPGQDLAQARPPAGHRRWRGISGLIWILEHAQDAVTVVVGIVLIVLAGVLLISGIAEFARSSGSVSSTAPVLLDRALLVLIMVEIVHTVVLSLRTHHLAARPFIVVGLVAVIRRILFVLTPGVKTHVSTPELALLIGMVAVFVIGLIAVNRFPEREEE